MIRLLAIFLISGFITLIVGIALLYVLFPEEMKLVFGNSIFSKKNKKSEK
jgi:hypothetical protein